MFPAFLSDNAKSSPIQSKHFVIGGIKTTIYGLDELLPSQTSITCLWILHPRLGSSEAMGPLATHFVRSWQSSSSPAHSSQGLIVATFDQRNHGGRSVETRANHDWRSKNPLHAQDMFSIVNGTAQDTSHLITFLSSYIFTEPDSKFKLTEHVALGISLGGHAVWHLLAREPRVKHGVVIVGCPDYASLMYDRARLSKLPTYTGSSVPGEKFMGSKDFPRGLIDAVEMYDPAGLVFRDTAGRVVNGKYREPGTSEVSGLLEATFKGKRIMNLYGRVDKLVPYARGQKFMDWFKSIARGKEYDIDVDDRGFEGVGHEVSSGMVEAATQFLAKSFEEISSNTGHSSSARPGSKI